MTQKDKQRPKVFCENVYDLETFFESLSIASDHDKELLFVDLVLSTIRLDPHCDLTDVFHKTLKKLDILK